MSVAVRFLLIWSIFLTGSLLILYLSGRGVKRTMVKRLLTWFPIIALLFVSIQFGKWAFFIFILAVFSVSHWELSRLVENTGFLRHAIAIGLALPWLVLAQVDDVPIGVLLSLGIFFAVIIYLTLFLKRRNPWMIFLFALMLGAGFSFWILLGRNGGARLVVFVFSVTAFNDIMGFFFGKLWGGAKVFPRLSPNKTLIGYGGGCLAAVLAAHVFRFAVPELNAVEVTLAGLLLALFGSLGDLMASKIKRIHEIKDFSSMMGVMGGVFDRCDSLLPSAWISSIIFFNIV